MNEKENRVRQIAEQHGCHLYDEQLRRIASDMFNSETRRGWLAPNVSKQEYIELFVEQHRDRDLDELEEMADIDKPLKDAIEIAGNKRQLALAIGVSRQTISHWKRVPPPRVLAVEKATGIRREVLRPDIYPSQKR